MLRPLPIGVRDWVTQGSRKGHASVMQGSIESRAFVCNETEKRPGWGEGENGSEQSGAVLRAALLAERSSGATSLRSRFFISPNGGRRSGATRLSKLAGNNRSWTS